MNRTKLLFAIAVLLLASCKKSENTPSATDSGSSTILTADSARSIAKEAWIYGYPLHYNYRSQYLYALDSTYSDYAGGFNRFKHYAKIFTYADTAVVTPNDDTPYSWAILNLSDEPIILEVPEIENKRYYVMQLIDLYTFNFAYVGSRSTGNKAGKYLVAGPDWNGDKPAGIDSVFRSETNLVTILGRTELINQADMSNVKKIQQKYRLTGLHDFLKTPAPPAKHYPLPLPTFKERAYMTPDFINVLNVLLQYTSIDPSESALRKRFAKIGIIPGKPFDSTEVSKETMTSIRKGIKEGEEALKQSVSQTTGSMELFGTRQEMKNDYLKRATAAAMGLYGNTKEEAVYVGSMKDKDGNMLTGDQTYVLHFSKEQLPKVKYFWSTTLYSLPKRYLVKNPINRYSIGDRSKGLRYNSDGSLDIYLQSTSPGKSKENNWLPTPSKGPFNYVIRLYGPASDITAGKWQQPLPEKAR